jgi:hypothetical protein
VSNNDEKNTLPTTMGRFNDEWVVDRVLFDYVAGGACACCGFQHFLPGNSTADLIQAVSDLDTDQVQHELYALDKIEHPWPIELRDAIWADRVRVRHKLKREMKLYRTFTEQHGTAWQIWCREQPIPSWQRWLQVPRSEILDMVRSTYQIHAAYAVVLCAVIEQVAFFSLTQYPPDGRGDVELEFEQALYYDRRGGFGLPIVKDNQIDEDVLQLFLRRCQSLGGPRLLERHHPVRTGREAEEEDDDDNNDEGDVDGATEQPRSTAGTTSFSSDRRIIRWLIARYWAQLLQTQYLASLKSSEDNDEVHKEKNETL